MKIGLQLYSIKNLAAEKGLTAALEAAKSMGYEGVEFAGLHDLSADEAASELKRLGLLCAGFHVGYEEVLNNTDKVIEDALKCGAYSLCVPAFISDTAEGWKEFAKNMNKIGEKFKKAGIVFGYHNHRHEWEPVENVLPMDILYENLDADKVFFEIDPRHAAVANADPVEYAKKNPMKCPCIHARDIKDGRDCTVGAGVVDFEGLIKTVGMPEWFIVENENFDENEQELEDSVKFLKTLR